MREGKGRERDDGAEEGRKEKKKDGREKRRI